VAAAPTVKGVLRRKASAVAIGVPVLRRLYQWERHQVRPRGYAIARDVSNRMRYGPNAPRLGERLWIDPTRVGHFLVSGSSLADSGRVEAGAYFNRLQPIGDDPILQAAEARWVNGLPWEETGEIERMERAIRERGPIKGCRTRADILERCARLDDIFRTVEREARLRPQGEVEPGTFREVGGIGMHIGPGGTPIRAANGRHRFAMVRILALPLIPVRIGVVHESALPLLKDLRRPQQA